jgi:orotate phosphoribosyltransferase
VPIRGLIPGMAVHLATCCHPLPGDRIVGIVTTGKGVTVHTIDCESLENFTNVPESWLDISWDPATVVESVHAGRLTVTLTNEPGSLNALTAVAARGPAYPFRQPGARMNRDQVLQEYRDAGALLEGHFILSSGLRSPVYMQSARVMMDPKRGERLCKALAERVRATYTGKIDLVVSPAMGGVVVGYELARQLGVPSLFTERVDGKFELRRGFDLPKGAQVLMCEDVVTTGKSSRECMDAIAAYGGVTVVAACLIDRSDGEADLGVPLVALTGYKVPAYEPDKLPPELQKIPAIKPGSRDLK